MQDSPDGLAFIFYVRDRIGGRLEEVLKDAWAAHSLRLKAGPTSGGKPERVAPKRRGPAPDCEGHAQTLRIVKQICGDKWPPPLKAEAPAIAKAHDKAGVPVPPKWLNKDANATTWHDHYEFFEAEFLKVIKYRIKKAQQATPAPASVTLPFPLNR